MARRRMTKYELMAFEKEVADRFERGEIKPSELKTIFNYNSLTGIFTQKKRTSQRVHIGDVAGYKNDGGYVIICFHGKDYRAHRLAWLWVHGEWPKHEIDHINGIRDDNRISNLRSVSRAGNAQNIRKARKDSVLGIKGIRFNKHSGKFTAQIRTNGETKHIGCFLTANEAHHAYLNAKRSLHLYCTI